MRNCGEISIKSADDANIPVNIFIGQIQIDDGGKYTWELTADNFMPRKGRCGDTYRVKTKDRTEMNKVVKKYILPLYRTAHQQIKKMSEGTTDSLYYWNGE